MIKDLRTKKIEAIKNDMKELHNLKTDIKEGLSYGNCLNYAFYNGKYLNYHSLYGIFTDVAYPALDEHDFLPMPKNDIETEYERKCSALINKKISETEELSGVLELRMERFKPHNQIPVNSELINRYKEGTLDTDAIYKKVVEIIVSLKDDFEKEYKLVISEAEKNNFSNMFMKHKNADDSVITSDTISNFISYGLVENFEKFYYKTDNFTYSAYQTDVRLLKVMGEMGVIDTASLKKKIDEHLDKRRMQGALHADFKMDLDNPDFHPYDKEFVDNLPEEEKEYSKDYLALKVYQYVRSVFIQDNSGNLVFNGFRYDFEVNDDNFGPGSSMVFDIPEANTELVFDIFEKAYSLAKEQGNEDNELSEDDMRSVVEEVLYEYNKNENEKEDI